jgi:phosphohistidine phosphatase
MKLYLVRHSVAVDYGQAVSDAERTLTESGIKRAHEMGAYLHSMDINPNIIISSTFERAIHTAQILAKELHYDGDIPQEQRITPMGRYEGFCDVVNENIEHEDMMFVGHEPMMSMLVANICADGLFRMEFKKCGVCCVEIHRFRPTVKGELLWYFTHKLLR